MRACLPIVICVMILISTLSHATDWTNYFDIAINPVQISVDQTNFPFLVSDANLPNGFWSVVQTNGLDLVFTPRSESQYSTGDSRYSREVATIDASSELLECYVNVPYISATTGATIRCWVGGESITNDPSVWDSDHLAVFHMNDNGSGGVDDSTAYGNSSTLTGGDPTETNGLLGMAMEMDGDDYFTCPTINLSTSNRYTVIAVVKEDDYSVDGAVAGVYETGGNERSWYVLQSSAGSEIANSFGDPSDGSYYGFYKTGDVDLGLDIWHHYSVTYNIGTLMFYHLGILHTNSASGGSPASPPSSLYNSSAPLTLGCIGISGFPSYFWDGKLDEIRILRSVLSSNRLNTIYHNLQIPDSFYSYGPLLETPVSWQYFCDITINASLISEDQSFFPLLLTQTNMPTNFWSIVQSNGLDMVFTDVSLTTYTTDEDRYLREIALVDVSNQLLECYVRIPNVYADSNTVIRCWLSGTNIQNDTGVWDADYLAVYHMSDNGSGGVNDSTFYGNHSTSTGGDPSQTNGLAGYAMDLDGDDYFDCPNIDLSVDDKFTVFTVVKENTYTNMCSIAAVYNTENDERSWYVGFPATNKMSLVPANSDGTYDDTYSSSSIDLSTPGWRHFTYMYNAGTLSFYNNGISLAYSPGGAPTALHSSPEPLTIGCIRIADVPSYFWDGSIDELRISKTTLSSNYIRTAYNNYSSPASFCTSTLFEYAGPIYITVSTNWTVDEHGMLYSNKTVIIDNCTVAMAAHTNYGDLGIYYFAELILTNSASMICEAQNISPYDASARGVEINADNLTIENGCEINADEQGFTYTNGPGAGTANWRGGSHGGLGGVVKDLDKLYGSATNPLTLGSGGKDSGATGGGAVKVSVTSNCVVNGTISSKGRQATTGGAGGSIWIICNTLSGSGDISVKGGRGIGSYCGGGSGGRIALDYQTSLFTGNIITEGGTGVNTAKAQPGTLSFPPVDILVIDNDTALASGTYFIPMLIITNNAYLHCHGNRADTNGVIINCYTTIIYNGSSISADYAGFNGGEGPGVGTRNSAGGSHGGIGGWGGGPSYGSISNPVALGSGGYNSGSIGGGAIHLRVTNLVLLNGSISSKGLMAGYSCGGAGGSIWIETDVFSGNGSMEAIGANAYNYAGGGGVWPHRPLPQR